MIKRSKYVSHPIMFRCHHYTHVFCLQRLHWWTQLLHYFFNSFYKDKNKMVYIQHCSRTQIAAYFFWRALALLLDNRGSISVVFVVDYCCGRLSIDKRKNEMKQRNIGNASRDANAALCDIIQRITMPMWNKLSTRCRYMACPMYVRIIVHLWQWTQANHRGHLVHFTLLFSRGGWLHQR